MSDVTVNFAALIPTATNPVPEDGYGFWLDLDGNLFFSLLGESHAVPLAIEPE